MDVRYNFSVLFKEAWHRVDLFAEDSGDESLNITSDPEVNQALGLQGRTKLQNTMEKSAMEHDHGISEKVKLESLRKLSNKDLLMGQINIKSIQTKSEELTTTLKIIGAYLMLISETKNDSSYTNDQFSIKR